MGERSRPDGSRVAHVWYGTGVAPRVARAGLAPLSKLFGAGVALRNALYGRGLLHVVPSPLPTVSVGNVSVGGTGKTPVAAYLAGELHRRGGRPAIVLRGYGADEQAVHALLNPEVPVIVAPDRVAGIGLAAARGATVAILDDAFQHRHAARDVDLVLVSADRWSADDRLLPAGPLREPLSAIRRASLAVITVRRAAPTAVAALRRAIEQIAPGVPVATALLRSCELVAVGNAALRCNLEAARGRRVLAIAAVADPAAFFAQLRDLRATLDVAPFSDHHPFTVRDVTRLAERVRGAELVVCTLKDAVKLRHLWPADWPQLWYVSQVVQISDGQSLVHESLTPLLSAR